MINTSLVSEGSCAEEFDRIYKVTLAVSPCETAPDSYTGLYWECEQWVDTKLVDGHPYDEELTRIEEV